MLSKWFNLLLQKLVRAYQILLSPFLGGRCRFYPSCSEYALEVLQNQPPHKALLLIAKRVSKCHPFGSHGVDLPPREKQDRRNEQDSGI